jgi:hypothetical protein
MPPVRLRFRPRHIGCSTSDSERRSHDIISCSTPQGAMDRQPCPRDHVTLVIDEIDEIVAE